MEKKDEIRENLIKDGNYYKGLGVTGHFTTGFHILDPEIELKEDERVFNIYTGLEGAVIFIVEVYKSLDEDYNPDGDSKDAIDDAIQRDIDNGHYFSGD